MTTLGHNIRKFGIASCVTLALSCLGQTNSWSAPLTLPDSPLFALNTVEPNVILTIDDSGSMAWGYLPDGISGLGGTRRFCSSAFNFMYYDPTIVYSPGVDGTGAALPNSSFTAAPNNPYNPADTSVVNLSTSYMPVFRIEAANTTIPINDSYVSCNTAPLNTPQPAFYYTYTPSLAGTGGCPNPAVTTDDDCYVKVTVSATSGPGSTDERTNFANWYTYYRVRMLATKSAAGRAFAQLGENMRLAYQRINTCNTGLGVAGTAACTGMYVKKFTGATRTSFFTWLIGSPVNGGTPLVQAADDVRLYMQGTNAYSPWAENPGTSIGTEHSCRQNFSIIMTDGVWNGGTVGANVDNTSVTLPDGTAYNPGGLPANRRIYPDTNSGFLADVVFNTWRTDARTTLTNNVPTYTPDGTGTAAEIYFNPVNDPANWQHAVTFTMGLGLDGIRDFPGDYNALLNGTLNWNGGDHVDDLWHAAVNGRGQYFSARNPQQIVDSFTNTLNQIQARIGSGAGLAANGGSVSSDRYLYQVKFNTSNWTGRLLALAINSTTRLPSTTPDWDAAVKLNGQNWSTDRNIYTYKPSTSDGVPFRWASLDAAQQDALNRDSSNALDGNGAARLDYLRGASTNEGVGLNFRTRTCTDINGLATTCPTDVGKLGDIIDSSAVYVGTPSFDYADTLETVTYRSFVAAQAGRKPMIYVGANDGMLHGFNASFPTTAASGREEMAYVPGLVYSNISTNNLSLLSWPSYTHRYYVDGTPSVGDAFFGGAWHTVLVGGLRKGGKGYYALDITDPSSSNLAESATNAANLVLWEFTDPELGYSYSQAAIVKVPDSTGTSGSAAAKKGRWAAVFGNGYNNTGNGHAVLYVVDIQNGNLIAKIDTSLSGGGGTAATPNGLATPAVVDVDQDSVVDYIYAGDLQGKMWRFDVRSLTPSDWELSANVSSIFTATDPLSAAQPITTPPKVGAHPLGFDGLMVYFGTGKYLETGDNTTTGTAQTQSFYGIYDRGVTSYSTEPSAPVSVARSDLLRQTISAGTTVSGFDTRLITNNPINWRLTQTAAVGTHLGWYVDLPTNGEKQVTDSLLREGRMIFTTLIPSVDPCTPGGSGWLMELNTNNGGRLQDTFDLNNDGVINVGDQLSGSGVAGIQPSGGGGAMSTPVILSNPSSGSDGRRTETKYTSTTTGETRTMTEASSALGRQTWRQLK